jgi:glutaredoxin-like protein NrdH
MNTGIPIDFNPEFLAGKFIFTLYKARHVDNMEVSKIPGKKNKHTVRVYALSTCVWCRMTKQFLKDNEIEYEYVDVDLCTEQDKEKIRKHIISKGGSLSYPSTIVDDKVLITGFRKDLLKEALEI